MAKPKLFSAMGYCMVMPPWGERCPKPSPVAGTFSFDYNHCLILTLMWADQLRPRAIEKFGEAEAARWEGYPHDGPDKDKCSWLRAKGFRIDFARVEVEYTGKTCDPLEPIGLAEGRDGGTEATP